MVGSEQGGHRAALAGGIGSNHGERVGYCPSDDKKYIVKNSLKNAVETKHLWQKYMSGIIKELQIKVALFP